jgi:hypothetical protein
MLVKPKPDLLVRDPQTKRPLPAEGGEVQLTTWWSRRLACGDVVPVTEESAPEVHANEETEP